MEKRFETELDVQYDELKWGEEHPVLYVPDFIRERVEKEKGTINREARHRTSNKKFISILPRKSKLQETKREDVSTDGWIQKVEISYKTIVENEVNSSEHNRTNSNVEFEGP